MFKREVFYEVHVKGFSILNKNIEESKRGKWLGLCSPWALNHYKKLGITIIQIMPIMLNDKDYKGKYWGYCPISFFEHNPYYGTKSEMLEMIYTLHKHGFKVIIDQVYNHTGCEVKGLNYSKNDFTGCGFPVAVNEPNSLKMIKESIIYWLSEIGFDGIRFDLAGCLGREEHKDGFNPNSHILKWIEKTYVNDKIFSGECYDLGGNFEHLFPEWMWRLNNDIRDQIRNQNQYLHTSHGTIKNNIALVTCHDGNTLLDNCSFQGKYNWDNGHNNEDGHNDNKGDNCSIEGLTSNKRVLEWRQGRADSMLNALQNYTGHVLLLQGDVDINDKGRWVGRMTNTQFGNNNVYCQDNEIGWVIWDKEYISKFLRNRK